MTGAREVLEARDATVCVVRYRPAHEAGAGRWYPGGVPPQNPSVLFTCTLRKGALSPNGELIYLDSAKGDQIHGWQWVDALEVVEVLGTLGEDGKTVVPLEEGGDA